LICRSRARQRANEDPVALGRVASRSKRAGISIVFIHYAIWKSPLKHKDRARGDSRKRHLVQDHTCPDWAESPLDHVLIRHETFSIRHQARAVVANTISISLSEMISGGETQRIAAAANQNAFVEATLGAFA
jgi:hypothetical protein